MDSFYAAFEDLVKKVMEEFQLVVPDTTVPDKIMKIATELFYERKSLETLICGILKKNDQIVASTWIDALLQSQDFFIDPIEGRRSEEGVHLHQPRKIWKEYLESPCRIFDAVNTVESKRYFGQIQEL